MGTDKKSHKYSSIEEQDFFASKLKELRHDEHITQKKLAEDININYRTISRYENCKAEPSVHHLHLLAQHFKVPISFFSVMDDITVEDVELLRYIQSLTDFGREVIHRLIKERLE